MVRAVFIAPIVAIIGVACLWAGVPALTLAATNWSLTELSCADYDPQQVTARWVRLSGCLADTSGAAYTTIGETVTEAYLPLWPESDPRKGSTPVVLASRGLQYIAGRETGGDSGDGEGPPRGAFEGTTRFADSLGADERRTLGGLSDVLRPDFVILDDGATPDIRLGTGLTLAGLLLLVLAAQVARSRRPPR